MKRELREEILANVRLGADGLGAAAMCGVDREQFDQLLQEPGFVVKLETAARAARAESEVGVRRDDPARWLEAVDAKKWNRKASLELVGDVSRPVSFIEVRPGGVVDALAACELVDGGVSALPAGVGLSGDGEVLDGEIG